METRDKIPYGNQLKNPYSAPVHSSKAKTFETLASQYWLLAFAMNLILPAILLFASPLLKQCGYFGVVFGVSLVFSLAWIISTCRPEIARRLLWGSLLVAPTQILPCLHLKFNAIAARAAITFGLAVEGGQLGFDIFNSEVGGFVYVVTVQSLILLLIIVVSALAYGADTAINCGRGKDVWGAEKVSDANGVVHVVFGVSLSLPRLVRAALGRWLR